jgi:hypothetical protein
VDDIGDFQTLDSSFGALGRKIPFVDNCATHSPYTSSVRNVKVVFCPQKCTVLKPLDLGLMKCFKQVYRKHTAVCLMDARKVVQLKIDICVPFTLLFRHGNK